LSVIRKQLEQVLPDTTITEDVPRAEAREKQRDLVEATRKQEEERVAASLAQVDANRQRQQQMLGSLVNITTPLVILTSALFVGLMTGMNVRERRAEIGVLRALGKNATNIAGLFLGKALLLGVIGGLIGCAIGYLLAPLVGTAMLDLAADLFRVRPVLVLATVVCAPVVTVLASYWPTWTALRQDPAIVLMEN
jgi:putative ABC transport system permease protein